MLENKVFTHSSGDILVWNWLRQMTPLVNGYAALFLIGGAILSTWRFKKNHATYNLAIGNAFGAILPGIGGGMAKAGIVEALYIGEFVGLLFIWAGYIACVKKTVPSQ